jgi:Type I phosphodiesterase / nucleotide pyrophosphatase
VSRDLYAGVPAVYVNYLDYDVAAHAFGPGSRRALLSLYRVDRAIRQLARVLRRVPEHRYDLYVLADHGQAPCRPYVRLSRGARLRAVDLRAAPGVAAGGRTRASPAIRAG